MHETESGAATLTRGALTCATGFASSLANPNSQRMADIVDAYSYFGADIWPNEPSKTLREHFATIPKMVVNAGNDEFFLPVRACTRAHCCPQAVETFRLLVFVVVSLRKSRALALACMFSMASASATRAVQIRSKERAALTLLRTVARTTRACGGTNCPARSISSCCPTPTTPSSGTTSSAWATGRLFDALLLM